jgi:hypothetical protein
MSGVADVLRVIASALEDGSSRRFHLGVVGYFIDDRPYAADGLSVSRETTPNFVLEDDRLSCEAFFPQSKLHRVVLGDDAVRRAGDQPVRVALEVKLCDVWAVAEFIDGVQHDLFLDAETLATRKPAFTEEVALWDAPTDPRRH